MAIAFFKHTQIKMHTQGRAYTTRAHARYIGRLSAALRTYCEHIPENYRKRQAWFTQLEDMCRKNGIISDQFIVAIPRELTPDHADALVQRYVHHLGHGRAPVFYGLHWEENNPHVHVLYIDHDFETHKKIWKTGQLGSQEKLKQEWERVTNGFAEEYGYDFTISFAETARLARERRLGLGVDFDDDDMAQLAAAHAAAERILNMKVANDNTELAANNNLATVAPPEVPAPIEPEEAPDEVLDDDMAATARVVYPTAQDALQTVQETHRDLSLLRSLLHQRETTQRRLEHVTQRANAAAIDAGIAFNHHSVMAQNAHAKAETLASLTNSRGGLKGFGISVFGLDFKTATRKQAEAAQEAAQQAKYAAERAAEALKEYQHAADKLAAEKAALEAANVQLEYQLAVHGNEGEIAASIELYEQTLVENLQTLDVEALEQLHRKGELSLEDYKELLHLKGDAEALEYLAELEHSEGHEQEL